MKKIEFRIAIFGFVVWQDFKSSEARIMCIPLLLGIVNPIEIEDNFLNSGSNMSKNVWFLKLLKFKLIKQ